MLRYVKHHLDTIADVDIYPIISLLIFFIFFTMIIVKAYTKKKEEINEISALPLDDELTTTNNNLS
ncbi:hypothetical protein NBRC110019_23020 [Neptunitalea chrysea]|uniref:CcoQ/FixQ family Cbb3-type cytochrome c oxidase assembly chaperone n=1 Tax=Neptunitalea chrysea TaxID=1647581 RepID=A0A9W6B869_9FLAO|nr:CcoQ/FixQ family Cbb3-type cytochrome c oxidase assembly chaperone [Neptunitalea chrysea]GLB53262.1 hypothetical protein NBRC110019_23020 [Neptunitalea chrysea]